MFMNALTALLLGLPSGIELVVIFAVVLLLFGGAKLPQLARSMGQAMRNFREETTKLKREVEIAAEEEDRKQAKTQANQTANTSAQNQSTQEPEEPAVKQ